MAESSPPPQNTEEVQKDTAEESTLEAQAGTDDSKEEGEEAEVHDTSPAVSEQQESSAEGPEKAVQEGSETEEQENPAELLPFVKDLVGMGFPENESTWAVHMTGAVSLDAAVSWILTHEGDPILQAPFDPNSVPGPPAWTPDSPHKMVLVVRMDLGMGRGKIAAQCAHAALGGYVCLVESGKAGRPKLRCWFPVGQTKIVVRCNSLEELEELEAKAQSADIPTFVVHDAGRTQIAAGSATVLAVGPDTHERVDWVTGNQKLL